jgi:TM2 domain-containing membrane protein YozV
MVVPFLVFVVALLVSGYTRLYADQTFQNDGLSVLTAFTTTILTLTLTWYAWKWSEKRFGGWANMRLMFSLLRSMARLEENLAAAQKTPELDAAAQKAWDAYVSLATAVGLNPNELNA